MNTAVRGPVPTWERDLVLRLGNALLREDVVGLRSAGVLRSGPPDRTGSNWIGPERRGPIRRGGPGGLWLARNGLRIPVRAGAVAAGDLVDDLVMARPMVVRVRPGRRIVATRPATVVAAFRAELGTGLPADLALELRAGLTDLLTEARAATDAARLRHRHRPAVLGRLRRATSPSRKAADRCAADDWLAAEALAAHRDHPIYPLSMARVGLRTVDLPRWAPEYAPRFRLRWVAVPAERVEISTGSSAGGRGSGPDAISVGLLERWTGRSSAPQVGAPDPRPVGPPGDPGGGVQVGPVGVGRAWSAGVDRPVHTGIPAGFLALPVHPAVPPDDLERALPGVPMVALPEAGVAVRPTLSMRTVVVEADRSVHLKLPLPMRTLGHRNLRLISRASLADGASLTRALQAVLAREARFRDTVLTADETAWMHVDNRLAVLLRQWPVLGRARVVPVAGLTARSWDGRLIVEELARDFFDGDLDALLEGYLRVLLTWQVMLWLRYGIAHEAHPQNVLVAVDRSGAGEGRLRLLLRDLDSCLVDPQLSGETLGPGLAEGLHDRRLIVGDPVELTSMVVTTALHQCVAAVLVETALGTGRRVEPLLARIRPLLEEVVHLYRDCRDAAQLITGVINAQRLPVKRTLTAATLLPKTRTGAIDVNKFYGADVRSYL